MAELASHVDHTAALVKQQRREAVSEVLRPRMVQSDRSHGGDEHPPAPLVEALGGPLAVVDPSLQVVAFDDDVIAGGKAPAGQP